MESIVDRTRQTTDSASSKVLGSSAKTTPPYYHQHCLFQRFGKLIASGSSGPTAIHLITDATSLRLGHCLTVPPSRVYCGQVATRGKLLDWGAKVNHLIDKGQWWRLATANFLHLNVTHLLVNSLTLNAIGPNVEAVAGPERFLTVYVTSGIACSAMSYRFPKGHSIGASGAIFGLVGYLAVYFLRHRGLTGDADKDLNSIGEILLLNLILGLSVKRIDQWGHVGGFLCGAAASWLLGPAGKLEYRSSNGRKAIDGIKGTEDPGMQP